MKRYLLFSGESFYPCGGWEDAKGSLSDIRALLDGTISFKGDWAHIVDTEKLEIVYRAKRADESNDESKWVWEEIV